MGGLGKTTLAEKIYNHSTIKTHFAGLAWVSISQKWQRRQILQRILIGLVYEMKEEIFTWDEGKLVENLLQIQQKKKCLIVLDDIWSNDAWDSIKAAFTAEKSLSKLMLTTRNVDVARHANPKGFIHQPECLSPDQSWELLQLKALPTRGGYLGKRRRFFRSNDIGEGNDLNLNHYDVSRVAKTRQLVFYDKRVVEANSYFTGKPNHQQYRSILFRNVDREDESQQLRLGLYLANFKLLRVLSLENVTHSRRSVLGTFSGTNIGRVLGSLVYLRYLSLRGSNLKTFPWIHNLVLLQTLNLNVPDDIFKSPASSNVLGKLAFLRHLYLLPWVSLKSVKKTKLRFNGLSKLETLENFNTEWCEVKDLPKLSGLRKFQY
ncbi:putative disease resistance protein RXW24L [Apium graveolens]|uniref:putative disease resistance protein RXW24L n=1 Tax=Apium graveolens TaxID=4045 RepID=UPI003D7A65AE